MISSDYNSSLNLVNIIFQPSDSHQKINLTANHTLTVFKMNVKNLGKIANEMLRSNIGLTFNRNKNVIISLSK